MCAGPHGTVSFYLSLSLSAAFPNPVCRAASRPLGPTLEPQPMLRWSLLALIDLKGKFGLLALRQVFTCLFLH